MPSNSGMTRAKERAIEAYRLRHIRGLQFPEIADELGVSISHARKLVIAGAKLCVTEELREHEKTATLAELDALRTVAYEYLQGEYLFAQFGKLVTQAVVKVNDLGDVYTEEVPLKDIGPNLAAMDRILRIEKRRADIFGYDAPKRATISVVTEDLIVAEIKRLEAELATAAADTRIGAALDGMPDGFPDTGLPDDGDDSLLDG